MVVTNEKVVPPTHRSVNWSIGKTDGFRLAAKQFVLSSELHAPATTLRPPEFKILP